MAKDFQVKIDHSAVTRFAKVMYLAPDIIKKQIGKAIYKSARYDNKTLRERELQPGSSLHVNASSFRNTFKVWATDSRKARGIGDLYSSQFTRADLAQIHQTGGVITPDHGSVLTVIPASQRNSSGKRLLTQKEIQEMLNSGEAAIVGPNGHKMIVMTKMSVTKTGNVRSGAKSVVLAYLVGHVTIRKRLNFFENFERNTGQHDKYYEEAITEAVHELTLDANENGRKIGESIAGIFE